MADTPFHIQGDGISCLNLPHLNPPHILHHTSAPGLNVEMQLEDVGRLDDEHTPVAYNAYVHDLILFCIFTSIYEAAYFAVRVWYWICMFSYLRIYEAAYFAVRVWYWICMFSYLRHNQLCDCIITMCYVMPHRESTRNMLSVANVYIYQIMECMARIHYLIIRIDLHKSKQSQILMFHYFTQWGPTFGVKWSHWNS